ncbi:MAG TPA: hypothetical protein VFF90_05210 [Saprospiraceae bacterium]|nr:hypothetical protein [Saprospiraceae bacterium]
MTFELFQDSLKLDSPPIVSDELKALWHDAKGDWDKSHNIIQDIDTKDAALIHAYLHRKEGDIWNADYWYAKSNSKRPDVSQEEEWVTLVKLFLDKINV